MSLVKSILLGSEGSYQIFGIPVEFKKELPSGTRCLSGNLIFSHSLQCLKNRTFCLATQSYAHAFVHEMFHAFVGKFLNQGPYVSIYTKDCIGQTAYDIEAVTDCPCWKKAVRAAAGPIGNMTFSSGKLITAALLKSYPPISITIASGALFWMGFEFVHGYVSLKHGKGDFGKLAKYGKVYFALASAALISTCALGIFTAMKIVK